MPQRPPQGKAPGPVKRPESDLRREREAEALRANLQKRKGQAKARREGRPEPGAGDDR
jgi:hypothetical protein